MGASGRFDFFLGPGTGATLDELLERIKAELVKPGPIIDLEVVRGPRGSRTRAA